MNRTMLLLATVAVACSAAPIYAKFDSAVVHIGVDDTGSYGIDNIVNYLQGLPRFNSVASVDVDFDGVPSAAQLSAYDSVLIVSDNRAGGLTGGGLGTQLGNVLDDYVLAGGRVVFSTFTGNNDIGVDGDILALAPHTLVGQNADPGSLDMGSAVTSHFVFHGVNSFESSWASEIDVSANGFVLASYLNGTLGVLTVADDSVMFVNGFPADEFDYTNGSDFGLLFANSLAPIPEPSAFALASLAIACAVGYRRPARQMV